MLLPRIAGLFPQSYGPTATQSATGAARVHGQRPDRAHSRPAGQELHGHFGARRNFQLPRGAIGPFLFHTEGRTRADPLRVVQAAEARREIPAGGWDTGYGARFAERVRSARRISDLRGIAGAGGARGAAIGVRAAEEAAGGRGAVRRGAQETFAASSKSHWRNHLAERARPCAMWCAS